MNQGKLSVLVHESIVTHFHILELFQQIEILILGYCTLLHVHIYLPLKVISFEGQSGIFKLEFLDGSSHGARVGFSFVY